MKQFKPAVNVVLFALLAASILGVTALSGSQAQAFQGFGNVDLTYLGRFEATITDQIVIGDTPRGLRHNVYYEGTITGERVSGDMTGIDYMSYRRSEGIDEVDTRATIKTDDGAYISVEITGLNYPNGVIMDSYVSFTSGHENYEWMNNTVFFGYGKVTGDSAFAIDYYYYEVE